MLEFPKEKGFDASAEDSQVAVGMRKGDPDIEKVNKILAGISQDERTKLWTKQSRINLQQQIVMNKNRTY